MKSNRNVIQNRVKEIHVQVDGTGSRSLRAFLLCPPFKNKPANQKDQKIFFCIYFPLLSFGLFFFICFLLFFLFFFFFCYCQTELGLLLHCGSFRPSLWNNLSLLFYCLLFCFVLFVYLDKAENIGSTPVISFDFVVHCDPFMTEQPIVTKQTNWCCIDLDSDHRLEQSLWLVVSGWHWFLVEPPDQSSRFSQSWVDSAISLWRNDARAIRSWFNSQIRFEMQLETQVA